MNDRKKLTQWYGLGFPGLVVLCLLSMGGILPANAQTCSDAAATPLVCPYDAVKNSAAKTHIKGVLLMDWTAGGHDKANTQNHLFRLSKKYGFRLDRSQSNTYITAATLQGIDLVVFNNGDQDPLTNSASLTAIKNFVEVQGKAFLVIHAGAAYIPCPDENLSGADCRWIMRGIRTQFWIHNYDLTKATLFADSVEAGQIPPRATSTSAVAAKTSHGLKNPETRMIYEELPTNGGTGALANRAHVWEGLGDEWYNYRNNPRLEAERIIDGITYGPVNVLLSLDESSIANDAGCSGGGNCKNTGTFGDRTACWTRKAGKGLAAYQNAGHSNVYTRQRSVGTSNVNDSIIEKFNWRLMRYLGRDFVGCMDSKYKEFNPEASVTTLTSIDDPAPCKILISTSISSERKHMSMATMQASEGIMIPTSEIGTYNIQISNIQGERVFSASAMGGSGKSVRALKNQKGTYLVDVTAPKIGHSISQISLQ
jgi:hypothetical protein